MKYERGSFITVASRDTLRGLHPTAQTLYMWLSSYANETGNCFPSRKTLAEDVACSERTVDTMVDLLVEAGLLEVKGRKEGDRQLSNLYKVLIVPTLAGAAIPPSRTCPTPLQELRTNSNQLTQTNEDSELEDELRFVVADEEYKPLKKEQNATKQYAALCDWLEKLTGVKIVNRVKQYTHLKKAKAAGIDPGRLKARAAELVEETFYQEHGLDWGGVVSSFDRRA